MIKVYTDVIQFRGNHYDFGYFQGELLKHSPILRNREKQWFSKRGHLFQVEVSQYKKLILQLAPKFWEEMNGLRDSLDLSLEKTIRLFGGYYSNVNRGGCSIFTSDDYMIRNYDNDPMSYEGRLVLFEPTDGGLATIGPSMQITGRTDGMNSEGLAMGYNFINTNQGADGFVCNIIGRLILEMCESIEEAVELLKTIPHRHSFSYILLDRKGNSVIVEASPREVTFHKGQVCTNHFQVLTEENRYRVQDSKRRHDIMTNRKDSITSLSDAFQMMNDPDKGVFSTNYGAWSGTLHTASYHTKTLQVGFSLGGNRLPVPISFQNWLANKNLNITTINGQLDTNIPFVQMVEL